MAGTGKITHNQEKAICALLKHSCVPDAARAVGVGERTLFRWLKDEDFSQAYSAARRELVRSAIVQVQGGMNRAVDVLVAIMEDASAPASSRVSAARTMIEFGVKAVELEDLESRIAEIEKTLRAVQGGKPCEL